MSIEREDKCTEESRDHQHQPKVKIEVRNETSLEQQTKPWIAINNIARKIVSKFKAKNENMLRKVKHKLKAWMIVGSQFKAMIGINGEKIKSKAH